MWEWLYGSLPLPYFNSHGLFYAFRCEWKEKCPCVAMFTMCTYHVYHVTLQNQAFGKSES